MSRLTKLAILDRDGILLRAFPEGATTRGPRSMREFEILSSVQEACELLRQAGYTLAVATNQPDIARKRITITEALTLQWATQGKLDIEYYATCPHDSGRECTCRKPEPGLLYQLAVQADANLRRAIMFGDRETDATAAAQAGIGRFCGIETNGCLLDAVKLILQGA